MIKGDSGIIVIQGDTYQKSVIIENVDSELIDDIYISCKDLGINKQLEYDNENDKFVFTLTSQETINLKSMTTTFDITVYFKDSKVKTVSYKSNIQVLPKTNAVNRNEQ